MRALWVSILWFLGLWTFLAVGADSPGEAALPAIHLVRVNDPIGMQGYDLHCAKAVNENAEPECIVTEVKASKTVQKTTLPVDRARRMAAAFLGQMPKEKIYDSKRKRDIDPPVADVLLVWKVQLGSQATEGILKRNPTEAEHDGNLKRAVLLLESELGQDED